MNRAFPQDRGFTLIELMVSLSAGMVILGALFLCYMQTERAARQDKLKAEAVSEATMIAGRINDLLSNTLSREVQRNDLTTSPTLRFSGRQIEIISTSRVTGQYGGQCLIENHTLAGDSGRTIRLGLRPWDETSYVYAPAGQSSDLFNSEIEFQYANEFDEYLEPVYLDPGTGPEWPRFISYTIRLYARKAADTLAQSTEQPLITLHSGVALP